jgi:hypothetical protein
MPGNDSIRFDINSEIYPKSRNLQDESKVHKTRKFESMGKVASYVSLQKKLACPRTPCHGRASRTQPQPHILRLKLTEHQMPGMSLLDRITVPG